jgi:hypothetical protein
MKPKSRVPFRDSFGDYGVQHSRDDVILFGRSAKRRPNSMIGNCTGKTKNDFGGTRANEASDWGGVSPPEGSSNLGSTVKDCALCAHQWK